MRRDADGQVVEAYVVSCDEDTGVYTKEVLQPGCFAYDRLVKKCSPNADVIIACDDDGANDGWLIM